MQIKTKASLQSEVEKKQDLVKVSSILFYVDANNCEKYVVTELIDGGFVASSKDEKDIPFWFSELQHGWEFG